MPPYVPSSDSEPATALGVKSKEVVLAFYEMAFDERRVEEAAEKYMAPDYVQHQTQLETGRDGFLKAFNYILSAYPDFRVEIKRAIVQDSMVVLHGVMSGVAWPPGEPYEDGMPDLAFIDIIRVEDGLFAEHWDVLQPIPAEAKNANTMF